MNKRVVFIVSTLNAGGIENYLLRFLKHYDNKILPIVICRGNEFGELEESFKQITNIELVKVDMTNFAAKPYVDFYKFLKKGQIDSIVDFSGHFSGILMCIARLAGISKRIVFYRESTYQFHVTFLKAIYIKLLKGLLQLSATKVLSNSITALDNFYPNRDRKSKRFKVIYNGIDFGGSLDKKLSRSDFGIPDNSFVIGHVGRFNFAKNHETIIKVAEKLCKDHDNIYFILCGKNTDTALKERISQHHLLKDKVKLLGYRSDVNQVLGVLDLFFFPSITEGQPNSLIEAMIMGLPIVASNITPIKETTPLIIHDYLLDPTDFVGFANQIEKYYLGELNMPKNLSEWAKNNFNAELLFKEFFNEL